MPGAVADAFIDASARLALGTDPELVWQGWSHQDGLEQLGRAFRRAHATGAGIASTVARLADDLAEQARADVERRARGVGVKAAVPLGVCFLPAFVLVGVVPMVAAMFHDLPW
jgi:hypothetical protein